jgi:hypothetical protein
MTTPTRTQPQAEKSPAKKDDETPGRWQVRLSHPSERKRVVFSSISERRARRFVANRYPRGSEAYLESPDGKFEHYEQERTGPHGEDAEQWGEFDPESYKPPEEQAPPGEAAWQDVEG